MALPDKCSRVRSTTSKATGATTTQSGDQGALAEVRDARILARAGGRAARQLSRAGRQARAGVYRWRQRKRPARIDRADRKLLARLDVPSQRPSGKLLLRRVEAGGLLLLCFLHLRRDGAGLIGDLAGFAGACRNILEGFVGNRAPILILC